MNDTEESRGFGLCVTVRACNEMSKCGSDRGIADGWRRSWPIATARKSMRRAGVSKPCVWRWQRRFMEAGVDALLHDKTRKPGKAPVPEPIVAQLVERTLGAPPGEPTHWTSRAMADVMGLAISTVQKMYR